MECPKCHRATTGIKTDTTKGRHGEVYVREASRCPRCDVWVTVETPKEAKE